MNILRLIAALAVFTLLSGCGFYLKGNSPATGSLQSVRVSYEQPYRVGDPPLVMALENRLRAQGILATTGAATHIHLDDIRNQRRLLSVSGIDGRAAEFELITRVQFDVTTNGKPQLENQELSARRAYSFDDTERLAAEAERDDLLAAMHTELADMILLRVQLQAANRAE